MSGKSVLLSRLGRGLVLLFGACFALDAWAGLSFSPPSVTATIHYSPTPPALTLTGPVAAAVNSPNQTLVGSLSTAGNLSINGVNVPLSPTHGFSYPVTLTQGVNTFVLLGVDLGGNRVTLTRSFSLDPTIPNTTLISVSVSGGEATFIGDVGSVDPDTLITVTDQTSGASVTVTSDANGAFMAMLPVQIGDQITITATDAAGNVSTALDLTIGANTAPSAPNLGLISASAVANGMTTVTGAPGAVDPTTQVTITNQTSGASIAFTSIYDGAFPAPEMLAALPGDVLKITATNAVGNTSAMIQVPGLHTTGPVITLNPQPPSISYTTAASYTITGTVSEPATLYLGGQIVVPLNPDLSFTYTTTLLPGNNGFDFLAVDGQGHTGEVPSFTVYLDIAPAITITSGQYTGQTAFTLTGWVSEGGTTLTVTDAANNSEATVSNWHYVDSVQWDFSQQLTLVPGENDLTLVDTDSDGGKTTFSTTIYVNAGAPTITITSPLVTNQNPYTLTGQLTKEGTLAVTIAGQTFNVPLNPDLSFSYQLPAFPQDGTYPLTLVATDLSSNQVTQTVTLTLETAGPTITVTNPGDNGEYTNQSSVTLTGNLTEAAMLYINGTLVPVGPGPSFSFSYSQTAPLVEGENDFDLEAVDAAGNPASLSWSINVDTQRPIINVPLISAVDILDGDGNPTGQATLNSLAGAIDNSPNPDSDVNLTLGGVANGQSTTTAVNGDGSFYATLPSSAEQPFNLTAIDEAGNMNSMRVQLGTACYTDGSTLDTQLTVADGGGTVTGSQGGTAVFQVTRTGALGFDTYVDYQIGQTGDTAVSGTDYTGSTGSLKIPAGAASANLSIPLLGSTDPSLSGTTKTFTLQILGTHNPVGSTDVGSHNTGNFSSLDAFDVGPYPEGAVTADLNGDGKLDVITANMNSNPNADGNDPISEQYFQGSFSVLLNTTQAGAAHATFAATQNFDAGLGTDDVKVADVNGDGKPDVIVSNYVDNTFMVFLNTTQPGSDVVSFAAPIVVHTDDGPDFLAVADMDGDGKPDVIVETDSSVQVFLNTTAQGASVASFNPTPVEIASVYEPEGIAIGDLNGDGKQDIVVSSGYEGNQPGYVTVYMNTTANSTPSFTAQPPMTLTDFAAGDVVIADFNHDGLPDLAVVAEVGPGLGVNGKQEPGAIDVFMQTAPSGSTPSFSAPYRFAVGTLPDVLLAADLDGDGKPDLAVGNIIDNTVSILLSTTSPGSTVPSFAAQMPYPAGDSPFPVLAADLNGDNALDLITANDPDNTEPGNTVSVLINNLSSPYLANGSCIGTASVTGTISYGLVPSTITITSPVGTSFASPYQVLSGNISSVGGASTLTVNGNNVPVNADGSFSLYITLQPGANAYQLTATSAAGVQASQTVTLTLNSPSLPAPSATGIQFQPAGSGQVTVTGAASSGATGVTVYDITDGNSMSGLVDGNGDFSVTLAGNLSDSFSVTFTSSGGQSAPVFMQGNDATLSISVTSPCSAAACSSPITVNGSMVSIAGTFTGPVGTGITVNGGVVQLSDGSFYANGLPLVPGSNTVTIVATTPGGLSTTQTLTINSVGSSSLVLDAVPSDIGTAPLTVGFTYSFLGTGTISTVKMSYLGNGAYDVDSDNPAAVTLSYLYNTPGVYPATLTLVDTNGTPYVATLNVVVQDPSLQDAAIRKTWQNFVGALSARDRAAAMNYLDYEAQLKYAPIVDTLVDQMPQIVGSFSNLFSSVSSGDRVEYTVVRVVDGQAQVFFVYFIQDDDGVWRIDAM
ncbi:MAG TPA: FG-GAP-like repeat-containing protein [Gammaproteobacteria bacterium]|jgi:hypothetical protein